MKRILFITLLIMMLAGSAFGQFSLIPPSGVGVPDDTAYNATSWDANTDAATKNAIRDKIETISSGHTEDEIEAFIFDADAETMPGVITFTANPIWLLSSPILTMNDTDMPGADKETFVLYTNYTDGADGSENADLEMAIQQDGAPVTILVFDESDDQWETTKTIDAAGLEISGTALGSLYEGIDAAIVKSDEAETIAAEWTFQDVQNFGTDAGSGSVNITPQSAIGGLYIDQDNDADGIEIDHDGASGYGIKVLGKFPAYLEQSTTDGRGFYAFRNLPASDNTYPLATFENTHADNPMTTVFIDHDGTGTATGYALHVDSENAAGPAVQIDSANAVAVNVPLGTVNAIGNIELGHATDTTLSRSGAGAVTIEGNPIVIGGASTPDIGIGTAAVAGAQLTLPQENDAATPTLAFGDGNTGFFESSDNIIVLATAGTTRWTWAGSYFYPNVSLGAQLRNLAATATTPVHNFRDDDNTGLGRAAADQLSLIAGGVEVARATEDATAGVEAIGLTRKIFEVIDADGETLTIEECSDTVVSNSEWTDGADIAFNLPDVTTAAAIGLLKVNFINVSDAADPATNNYEIDPNGTDVIVLDGTALAAGNSVLNTTPAQYDSITCYTVTIDASSNHSWICNTVVGTWADQGS